MNARDVFRVFRCEPDESAGLADEFERRHDDALLALVELLDDCARRGEIESVSRDGDVVIVALAGEVVELRVELLDDEAIVRARSRGAS